MGQPALFQVSLMILFGAVELRGRRDLCDDRLAVAATVLKLLFYGPGRLLLLGSVIKNSRPVLCPNVRALPVQRSRIMVFPNIFSNCSYETSVGSNSILRLQRPGSSSHRFRK